MSANLTLIANDRDQDQIAPVKLKVVSWVFGSFILLVNLIVIGYQISGVTDLTATLFTPGLLSWKVGIFMMVTVGTNMILGLAICALPMGSDTRSTPRVIRIFLVICLISNAVTAWLCDAHYVKIFYQQLTVGFLEKDMSTQDLAAVSFLRQHMLEWSSIQESQDCCGWGSLNDDLATGPACQSSDEIYTCRDTFFLNALSYVLTLESAYCVLGFIIMLLFTIVFVQSLILSESDTRDSDTNNVYYAYPPVC